MRAFLSAVIGTAFVLATATALAQVNVRDADVDMFPAGTAYDAAIPTPQQFLGFRLGDEPVRHHQLVDYITEVAELSDRDVRDLLLESGVWTALRMRPFGRVPAPEAVPRPLRRLRLRPTSTPTAFEMSIRSSLRAAPPPAP